MCLSRSATLYLDGDDELAPESVGSSRKKLSHGRVLRCLDCGLGFRSFRPSPEQLGRLYADADDAVYEAESANRWKTAQTHRRIVERYTSAPGCLLDVGCASGGFLRAMADAGWHVFGVEPSASQYERAKRMLEGKGEIQNCVLEEARFPPGIDVLTLFDVLEHVTYPVAFLERCASHLGAGGTLILNVPQIDSFFAKFLRRRWPLLLAEHLNYFTRESLRICGEKCGLRLMATGSRPVSFSVGYISFRLAQSKIPMAELAHGLGSRIGINRRSVPVYMGEILAVYRKA
ncbi:MAG TPA: class I SAM-dependent methyltransferase [Bryobacteraceae bacterium]|nr:class I SAM-dependent methyltransferase [Bryobacteraceae bacterium]